MLKKASCNITWPDRKLFRWVKEKRKVTTVVKGLDPAGGTPWRSVSSFSDGDNNSAYFTDGLCGLNHSIYGNCLAQCLICKMCSILRLVEHK